MRNIINSTYISLDGVIRDPQDWPDNGIEGDGAGQKVQTDLPFRPAATAQLELAGPLALNTGIVILTYRVPLFSPGSSPESE